MICHVLHSKRISLGYEFVLLAPQNRRIPEISLVQLQSYQSCTNSREITQVQFWDNLPARLQISKTCWDHTKETTIHYNNLCNRNVCKMMCFRLLSSSSGKKCAIMKERRKPLVNKQLLRPYFWRCTLGVVGWLAMKSGKTWDNFIHIPSSPYFTPRVLFDTTLPKTGNAAQTTSQQWILIGIKTRSKD